MMFSLGDDIEVLSGQVVVHSHLNAPCTRCGAMDIHTLDECTERTRAIALARAPGRS